MLGNQERWIKRAGAGRQYYTVLSMQSSAKTVVHQINVTIADDHPIVQAA